MNLGGRFGMMLRKVRLMDNFDDKITLVDGVAYRKDEFISNIRWEREHTFLDNNPLNMARDRRSNRRLHLPKISEPMRP